MTHSAAATGTRAFIEDQCVGIWGVDFVRLEEEDGILTVFTSRYTQENERVKLGEFLPIGIVLRCIRLRRGDGSPLIALTINTN